jgi:hypothetical protein
MYINIGVHVCVFHSIENEQIIVFASSLTEYNQN